MRKLFTLAALVALALVSCDKDRSNTGAESEKGSVAVSLNTATTVEATRAALATEVNCTVPAAEDFGVVINGIRKESGEAMNSVKEYASIAEVAEDYFYRGYYKATVTSGDINEEGYNKPTFVGVSEEFHVEARKTANVQIEATIANALVKVVVTDGFKDYFSEGYELELETSLGKKFDVTDQTDLIFIAPASFKVSGVAYKQPNQSGTANQEVVLSAQTFENIQPRTIYTVKMDVSTAGQATLKITLNDNIVDESPIETELNPWA